MTALNARLPRLLANILLAALVVHSAWFLAQVTWMLAWQTSPVDAGIRADPVATQMSGTQGSLARHDLFGRPSPGTLPAESVRENAPETGLRLRLEGVLVGSLPDSSGAIVAGNDGVTAHYRIGETLPGNAELVEVEPGRILLRRQGEYERLTFDQDEDTGAGLAAVDEATGDGAPADADAFFDEARSRLQDDASGTLAQYGLAPAEDGSPGYVFDGSNAMLRAVNLQEGDTIVAINGQSLGDVEQDLQLIDSWRSQSRLDIEIERDGARFTVSYALPQ